MAISFKHCSPHDRELRDLGQNIREMLEMLRGRFDQLLAEARFLLAQIDDGVLRHETRLDSEFLKKKELIMIKALRCKNV